MDSKGKGKATDDAQEVSSANAGLSGPPKQSVGIIAIGMAGSGALDVVHSCFQVFLPTLIDE